MGNVTLEQINKNVLAIKHELDEIKHHMEEDHMELSEETKKKVEESRKRPIAKMKSQKEIENKFL